MVGGFTTWLFAVAKLPGPLAIAAGIAVTPLIGLAVDWRRIAAITPTRRALYRVAFDDCLWGDRRERDAAAAHGQRVEHLIDCVREFGRRRQDAT